MYGPPVELECSSHLYFTTTSTCLTSARGRRPIFRSKSLSHLIRQPPLLYVHSPSSRFTPSACSPCRPGPDPPRKPSYTPALPAEQRAESRWSIRTSSSAPPPPACPPLHSVGPRPPHTHPTPGLQQKCKYVKPTFPFANPGQLFRQRLLALHARVRPAPHFLRVANDSGPQTNFAPWRT